LPVHYVIAELNRFHVRPEDLKVLANRRDVTYQSLLKVFLAERLTWERQPRPV